MFLSGPGYERTKFVLIFEAKLKKNKKLETGHCWTQCIKVAFVSVAEEQGEGCVVFALYHLAVLSVDKCLALRSLLLPLKNRPYHCRVLEKDSVTV